MVVWASAGADATKSGAVATAAAKRCRFMNGTRGSLRDSVVEGAFYGGNWGLFKAKGERKAHCHASDMYMPSIGGGRETKPRED
jgi:hypothetical protein